MRYSLLLLVMSLPCLSGCSLGGQNTFSSQNMLSEQARRERMLAADIPRETRKTPLLPYRVEAGDGLLILPLDPHSELRLPSDQTILQDGSIDLGEYGRLNVTNKTLEQIQNEVQAQIDAKDKEAGKVSVRLVNRVSKVYYVLGEVNTPGSFPLSGRETVLDAIIAAGGLSDRASTQYIILSRPCLDGPRMVLEIDYDAIVQLADSTTNYQLLAGDRVFVPAKSLCEKLSVKKKTSGNAAHHGATTEVIESPPHHGHRD